LVARAYLPQSGRRQAHAQNGLPPRPLPSRRRPHLVQRSRLSRRALHTEYREDFNHQHQTPRIEKGVEYGDLPKFVDFDYVANVARLNAATLASLAAAPAAPANVRMSVKELENVPQLAWDAVPGASGL